MSRVISYGRAINEALQIALRADRGVICFGLGVDDPKGVFGTTVGLREEFGPRRVFDMPTAENAMTGVAVGASLNGIRPIMTHQRFDFFLLAMDQLVNNAAKWRYMFGGQKSVPLTIRLIIGRGWGQGPTHSQNLQAWLAHVPGLKVVAPALPEDAKGLLLASVFDDDPVVFLEHRWLHGVQGDVPEGDYRTPIGLSRRLAAGHDVTIVSMSYMTIEALHAVEHLRTHGVTVDLLDVRTVQPLDWAAIFGSVKQTGRLLVLDTAAARCSVAGEIIARVCMELFETLKKPPIRLAAPDIPIPTSPALSEQCYRRAEDIVAAVGQLLDRDLDALSLKSSRTTPHDVPGEWFRGPF